MSLPVAKTAELIEKSKTLALGDTERDVVAKMGVPDARTEMAPKMPREAPVKWTLMKYYVHKADVGLARDSDQVLELWFDEDHRLKRVVPRNIPGVKPLP